jgi:hypothetical protein
VIVSWAETALQSEKVIGESKRESMSERGTRRRIADWWERKTTRTKSTPSRALVSADSLDERLRNVYSFHAATPVVSGVYDMLLDCSGRLTILMMLW